MFSAFVNSFKIKELRVKILIALGLIALTRLLANIPCPGVDLVALKAYFTKHADFSATGSFMGLFDLFSGGALQQFAVGSLGIMPYISASIIMQLLVPVFPSLEKMVREGEGGRQKINQITRYLTVIICIVQGTMAALAMVNPQRLNLPAPDGSLVLYSGWLFVVPTVIFLTCGAMFLMWIGEQITQHGIGNGASLIITVGIVSRMPSAFYSLYDMAMTGSTFSGSRFRPVQALILLIIFALVTAATIMLTQGQRKIPIQMAKRIVGNKMKGGSTYMPLKVNFSGVMPIIFASAILMFPSMVLNYIPIDFVRNLAVYFYPGHPAYLTIDTLLIIGFSYFWVANQFNPIQIADNLKKEGAYVPGIRPGKPTAEFLDNTMTRITLAGALFLAGLALFPSLLYQGLRIDYLVASFFGGTSLLIMVGVVLDTLSQLESHLVMRNYDGFLKRGRLRGRRK